MSDGEPSSYDELLSVIEHLPILVREKRRRLGLSLRSAAILIDVSFSTISRCEKGQELGLSHAVTLIKWVGTPDKKGARS